MAQCSCEAFWQDPYCSVHGKLAQPEPTRNDEMSIQELVLDDIQDRMEFGRKKYGTLLQPFNGRDALRDAYEEALDLVMYLRQAIEERDASG